MNKTSFTNENPVFSLDGIPNPEWVKVTDITDRLLPVMTVSTTNVSGRVGNVRTGKAINTREIQIAFFIKASNEQQMRERARVLANHFLHATEQVKYINYKEPDGYYMVDIQSGGELREQLMLGRCLITLLATDPHFYSHEPTTLNPTSNIVEIVNNGADTFPKISFEMAQATTEVSIVTQDRFMQIGSNEHGATEPVDNTVLDEQLTSTAGWFPAPWIEIGNIVGQTTAGQWGFQQLNNNFGPHENPAIWRGSGLRRALPRTVKNWDFSTYFDFSQHADTSRNRMGRIMVTLLDVNGGVVATMQMRNTSNGFNPHYRVRVNTGQNPHRTVVDFGHPAWTNTVTGADGTPWMGAQVWWANIVKTDTAIHTAIHRGSAGGWVNDFGGSLHFPAGTLNDIAQVQIDFATRTTLLPTQYMSVRSFMIRDLGSGNVLDQDPWIFRQGDQIEINSENGSLTRNGVRWFNYLSPDSRFPVLHPGVNQISFPEQLLRNLKIEYRERRL